MGNSTDTTSFTDQTTKTAANSLTNFLSNMAKQYASNTAQNTAMTQTYSPSDVAKAMLAKATQPISAEQIAQYQSPYQKDVIDATMAQLAQQYGVQQSALTGNAIAQGALGGDRAKIAQAALMGEQGRTSASTLAGLLQQGYTQALSAAQQDQARLLQAAGLSGGTTVGGSSMTGSTTGREAGQQYGTSATSQSGISSTKGYGTSQTQSDPSIFGLDLGFKARGGAVSPNGLIRHRDDGGGIPSWARPPAMITSQPMPMIVAPSGGQKNMSTKDMIKLGDKARVQLDKMFSSEGSGSGEFSGAGEAGTAETGALASDAGVTAADTSAAAADAAAGAAGAGEAAGAVGAGAGEAAAGAGEAAGALGKGAAGAGEAGSGLMALLALLKDGGEVRHRGGGGGLDMPGMKMGKGIGQNWFNVPQMDMSMGGIKGSGDADGGAVRHRDAGGQTVQAPPAYAPMPTLEAPPDWSQKSLPQTQAPEAVLPGDESNGKGQMSFHDTINKYRNVVHSDDPYSAFGKGSSAASFAEGGHVRKRAYGGEDDFDPLFMNTGNIGSSGSEGLGALSSIAASNDYVDKPLERSPEELEARRAAIEELRSRSRQEETSPTSSFAGLRDWWNKPSEPDTSTQLKSFVDQPEPAKPSIADLAPATTEDNVEPVPIHMKTMVPIDTETGKPLNAPGAEPGAEELAPEKPVNHAVTVADVARANGMSENGIRGLLANTQDESGFEPGLRHPDQPDYTGEAHYAHGLFQFGGDEWNKYDAWLKKNHEEADWKDPKLQSEFMIQNLKENYPKVWKTMNEGTPEEAAQAYLNGYLKPAERYRAAREEKYGKGILGVDDYTNAPSSVSRREESETPAKTGTRSLAALVPSSTTAAAPASSAVPGQESGNLLTRIIDAGFNPLKMSDRDLSFIAQTALGGLGGINKAAETYQGTRGQDIQAQQHALQMALEAQKLQQQLAQPTVMGETYDQSTGLWHKQYGFFDPKTNTYKPAAPVPGSAAASGPVSIDAIAPDKTGNEFVTEAKNAGYSPAVLSTAQRVADYKVDPNKLASVKGEQRAIIDRLASRINPDYDGSKYAAVADSEKKLATGDVSKALRSTGRLFDEVEQTLDLARKSGNTMSEYANKAAYEVYPSGSPYARSMAALGTSLNNVLDTASAVAKGGGQGAEGDVKRRSQSMNRFQHPETLAAALKTEAEVGLKNAQSNLIPYNAAHGYTPDNPKYKTVMDYMTPAQQKKAIAMLGPDKIEEITGKPVKGAAEAGTRPVGVSKVQQATQKILSSPPPSGKTREQLLAEGKVAIAKGADPAKVKAQLETWGVQ